MYRLSKKELLYVLKLYQIKSGSFRKREMNRNQIVIFLEGHNCGKTNEFLDKIIDFGVLEKTDGHYIVKASKIPSFLKESIYDEDENISCFELIKQLADNIFTVVVD